MVSIHEALARNIQLIIKMYALQIEVKGGDSSTSATSATGGDDLEVDIDEIQVSAGNPRVEHLTGIVHLYRQTKGRDDAGASAPALPVCNVSSAFPSPPHEAPLRLSSCCKDTLTSSYVNAAKELRQTGVQAGRGTRLCVHALPASMGVADFCSFVGAFLPSIREMRLVRREGGPHLLHGPAHLCQRGHHGRLLPQLQQQAGALCLLTRSACSCISFRPPIWASLKSHGAAPPPRQRNDAHTQRMFALRQQSAQTSTVIAI